jgi:hypothetical protein
MQSAPTNEDMEKGRVQKVINDEMITKGQDDRPRYIEDDDVEIIVVQETYHQQLKGELLM